MHDEYKSLLFALMRKIIIGVMGPGAGAKATELAYAYELGLLIGQQGWVLLTGGRNMGVMDAANLGAKAVNGLTIGILPTDDTSAISSSVDIAIITDMGNARNNINVLSSDVVIACGMGAGTASEIALALKQNRKVILLNDNEESKCFFKNISPQNVYIVDSPSKAIKIVKSCLVI